MFPRTVRTGNKCRHCRQSTPLPIASRGLLKSWRFARFLSAHFAIVGRVVWPRNSEFASFIWSLFIQSSQGRFHDCIGPMLRDVHYLANFTFDSIFRCWKAVGSFDGWFWFVGKVSWSVQFVLLSGWIECFVIVVDFLWVGFDISV